MRFDGCGSIGAIRLVHDSTGVLRVPRFTGAVRLVPLNWCDSVGTIHPVQIERSDNIGKIRLLRSDWYAIRLVLIERLRFNYLRGGIVNRTYGTHKNLPGTYLLIFNDTIRSYLSSSSVRVRFDYSEYIWCGSIGTIQLVRFDWRDRIGAT